MLPNNLAIKFFLEISEVLFASTGRKSSEKRGLPSFNIIKT
jgi:hypothetical protein